MKFPEDAAVDGQRDRHDRHRYDSDSHRWRGAMTRRDHAEERSVASNADGPDLPGGWCLRSDDAERVAVSREGGDMTLAATRDGGIWRITARQRVGEAVNETRIGAAATRDEAVRYLFEGMEAVNAKIEGAEYNHVCLAEAVDDVCKFDAPTLEHIVQ